MNKIKKWYNDHYTYWDNKDMLKIIKVLYTIIFSCIDTVLVFFISKYFFIYDFIKGENDE